MKDVVTFRFDDMIFYRINSWNVMKYVNPDYWRGRKNGITDEEIKSLVEDIQNAGYEVLVVSNRVDDAKRWLDNRGIKPDRISKEDDPMAAVHFKFCVDDSVEIDKSICPEWLLNIFDISK